MIVFGAEASGPTPWRVAVVGVGPRGLGVLERAAARLAQRRVGRRVELYAIDPVEPGTGRIWRTDQSPFLLMNTPAGEVTMFSGPPDRGPARPGAGPSLAQWWRATRPVDGGGEAAYAPRYLYGQYLRFVLDAVERGLPDNVVLHRLRGCVVAARRAGYPGGWELTLDDGRTVEADRVVLTPGHPRPELDDEQRTLSQFADSRPHLQYVRGDSAADMALDGLAAGATVGVIGLGLGFYDVVSLLTQGRGGRFVTEGDALRYVPSGGEPHLVAGSRTGVPLLARGRNQKGPRYRYRPRIFTRDRIEMSRLRGRLDFDRQVLPPLLAEVNLVYYSTDIRARLGERVAELFAARAAAAASSATRPEVAVAELATRFGCEDLPRVDLEDWYDPFARDFFPDRSSFEKTVADLIRLDIQEAEKGNIDGPMKAALDVIRDLRGNIRTAVDLSGLTPASHRDHFLGRFVRVSSHLSTGPPMHRLRELLALIEADVLELAGPRARFGTDQGEGCFVASSPLVQQEPAPLQALVDARIPGPDVRTDASALTRDLLRKGFISSYANVGDDEVFDTGGLAVSGAPYHPVDAHGRPVTDLYALGIPTEHARWFMQIGNSRPGTWGDFMNDADAIAVDLLPGTAVDVHAEVSA